MLVFIVFGVSTVEGTKKTKVTSRSREAFTSVTGTFVVKLLLATFVSLSRRTVVVFRFRDGTIVRLTVAINSGGRQVRLRVLIGGMVVGFAGLSSYATMRDPG